MDNLGVGMCKKFIQYFKLEADKLIQQSSTESSITINSKLNQLIHQFMLNEYGFNYLLEMEFNDDILKVFQELKLITHTSSP